MNLSKGVKVTRVANAAAAAQTAVDSSILDMSGFDGVMFIALLGTVTDGSVLTLTPKQNTTNSTSGAAAISGAATSPVTAAANSNAALLADIQRPQQQFVYVTLTRTAQNAALDGIIAIQYEARKKPTTQDVGVIASAFSVPTA